MLFSSRLLSAAPSKPIFLRTRHWTAVISITVGIAWLGAGAGCDQKREQTSSASSSPAIHPTGIVTASAVGPAEVADDAPDPEVGREVFIQTCATCHGFQAQGLPHQGAPLRSSSFVASHSDKDLITFIKSGRPAKDPTNISGVAMPPRGNNPALSDARLADVVAYLRQVQEEAKSDATGPTASTDTDAAAIK
jgi:mono/diheme cytochrome c family protein